MGLDSYIYRSTNANIERYEAASKEYGKHVEECEKFLDELKAKYPAIAECEDANAYNFGNDRKTRDLFFETLTEHEFYKMESLVHKCAVLPSTPGEELQYWRKNWVLHDFIVDNFCKTDPDNPKWTGGNCERIYLTPDDINKIIKYFEKKDDTIVDLFRQILDEWEDDTVIYYWGWF